MTLYYQSFELKAKESCKDFSLNTTHELAFSLHMNQRNVTVGEIQFRNCPTMKLQESNVFNQVCLFTGVQGYM